jgi:hypothetical protein
VKPDLYDLYAKHLRRQLKRADSPEADEFFALCAHEIRRSDGGREPLDTTARPPRRKARAATGTQMPF